VFIARSIEDVRGELRRLRPASIGFVPTMGYLHAGHASLVERAAAECDHVVASIFVNPTQFGPHEDFERYPRDEERDIALLESAGASLLFAPSADEMYPAGFDTGVQPGTIAAHPEGPSRPGHFAGVATVVLKLLNIVQPDRAYFGLKDAQQVAVIQRLVCDLNVPTTIVPCETVRDEDGVALSSRNMYLSNEERVHARSIYRGLAAARRAFEAGLTDVPIVVCAFRKEVEQAPLCTVEHATIVDLNTFELCARQVTAPSRLIVRVRVGDTFLDDNIALVPASSAK
jgi:pantoate--beta-alanine ligase